MNLVGHNREDASVLDLRQVSLDLRLASCKQWSVVG